MRPKGSVLVAVLVAGLIGFLAHASEEVTGCVVSMNDVRIVVKVDHGDLRAAAIGERTRFFRSGVPVPIRRVLPQSKVRIATRGGEAETIFILEVPQ